VKSLHEGFEAVWLSIAGECAKPNLNLVFEIFDIFVCSRRPCVGLCFLNLKSRSSAEARQLEQEMQEAEKAMKEADERLRAANERQQEGEGRHALS
jgi:hypothetical protein